MAPAASASAKVPITVSPAPVTSATWSVPWTGRWAAPPAANSDMPRLPRVTRRKAAPSAARRRSPPAASAAPLVVEPARRRAPRPPPRWGSRRRARGTRRAGSGCRRSPRAERPAPRAPPAAARAPPRRSRSRRARRPGRGRPRRRGARRAPCAPTPARPGRVLAVVAHDLLLDAGRRAGQDAHLGRRRPARHRHHAVDRRRRARRARRRASRPSASSPTQPTGSGRPPSARTLATALAPPPGASDSPSQRRISTGASRLMRFGVSGDETVGDQVDEQEDRLAGEGVDQLEQSLDARRLECGGQGGSRSRGFCHEPARRPGAQAPARPQRRTAVGYSGRVKVPSGRNPPAAAAARTGPR